MTTMPRIVPSRTPESNAQTQKAEDCRQCDFKSTRIETCYYSDVSHGVSICGSAQQSAFDVYDICMRMQKLDLQDMTQALLALTDGLPDDKNQGHATRDAMERQLRQEIEKEIEAKLRKEIEDKFRT